MTARWMAWAWCVVGMVGMVGCAEDAGGRMLSVTDPAAPPVSPSGVPVAPGTGGGAVGDPLGGAMGGGGNGLAQPPAVPELFEPDAGIVMEDNCNQDVDVVFVLDVSGSMFGPLGKLQQEIERVDAALAGKNLPSPPRYGLVLFVDNVEVMNGGEAYGSLADFKTAVGAQVSTAQSYPYYQVGSAEQNLSWPENSLDALHAAATQFNWRPEDSTLRMIIHFTDASFWDGEAISSGSETAGSNGCTDDPLSWTSVSGCTLTSSERGYEETLDALRQNSIWVNLFAAKTGGPPGGVSITAPASHQPFRGTAANVGIGFHEPYDGKRSLAEATGGLAWDIDEVYDGVISLADPINQSIEDRQCVVYAPPPVDII